ncbi:Nucleic-acid-binding protein from transposon X-element [Eumeta japonica]|uniref:Nucleic-acid-binding protein from transposon X-element n=1 Tax=Eumeta variegata TaxID=151549 RepID=A0A4C1U4H9_EUMVA|nr:Nucleic-acid-binding protein from transposon X-element [Eumeta japonica]
MPGITIEGWRGREGPPQCYRCQTLGYSSVNYHRPQRCVRCVEGHIAADCTRPRDQGPTCANCQGPHPLTGGARFFERWHVSEGAKSLPPLPLSQIPPPHRTSISTTTSRSDGESGSPQWRPDDRPAHLSSSIDIDIGGTGPTNDRTPTYRHYKTSVGRGGTHGGGKTKKKAEEGTISTPAPPPEQFTGPPRVQSSRAASEAAVQANAHSRGRSAMVPPPPIARPRGEPQREMPLTILTSKQQPALPINQISQSLIRTDPNTWLLEQLTEILRTIMAGQDPIQTVLQALLHIPGAHRLA